MIALVLGISTGCVTQKQVADIVQQSNASILASQWGIDTELQPNPSAEQEGNDLSRKIDAFIVQHPDQPVTASALRIRQAVFELSRKNYELARAAFDAASLEHLHSARDQALKELAPHIIWWHRTAGQRMERPELRAELPQADRALAAFDEQIAKRAGSPAVRDFLAEMRAWIGLKFAESGETSADIGQRLGDVVDNYATSYDADDLLWFSDPSGEQNLPPDSVRMRRRLRARAVFHDARDQIKQLDAADRPQLSEKAQLILESDYLTRPS
jgi:hypothetical protein